ncbi:MAG TPA: hypothetical protein VN087_14430 [Verrucomicrobiae bacterium]|nr:hypothetical protein [Verrucomicrobiae bacterium]
MKNYRFFILLCMITVFVIPARPQTPTTNLVMGAHWDDGTSIQGTVTLGQVNASGPNTVIATKILSSGWTNVSEPLSTTSMYDVILITSANAQLVKFPITTALINPGNLQRAEIDLIFRKADNSLKSANITVAMQF